MLLLTIVSVLVPFLSAFARSSHPTPTCVMEKMLCRLVFVIVSMYARIAAYARFSLLVTVMFMSSSLSGGAKGLVISGYVSFLCLVLVIVLGFLVLAVCGFSAALRCLPVNK